MIKLRQCSKNPHHWYSAHSLNCPWCAVQQQTGSDFFPLIANEKRNLPRSSPPDVPSPLVSHPASPKVQQPAGKNIRIIGVLIIISVCIIGAWIFLSPGNPNSPLGIHEKPTAETGSAVSVEDIQFDPIDTHYLGDKFTIFAETRLLPGEKIIYEISPASSEKIPKNRPFSGDTGIAVVTQGTSEGLNTLAFVVDSSSLAPKEYIVRATSINQTVWGASRLTILEGRPPATRQTATAKPRPANSPVTYIYPVTIAAKGSELMYYRGETIHFTGTNAASDTTYLFLLGPGLPKNGARFTLTPEKDPVKDNDPATFTTVPINSLDRTWSYDWNMNNVALENQGIYTIYSVSAPRDRSHLSGISSSAIPIIIKEPFISSTAKQAAVKRGNPVTITGTAEGNPSSVIVWVFWNGYVVRMVGPVQSDASFKIDIPGSVTKDMPAGDYYYVAQHPDNNQFDIDYNAETGQVYNTKTGNIIFNARGQNRLDGSAAVKAFISGVNDDPAVDDHVTKGQFKITA